MDMQIQSECTRGTPVLTNGSLFLAHKIQKQSHEDVFKWDIIVKFILGDFFVYVNVIFTYRFRWQSCTSSQAIDLSN
jgi:hypothetical protein